MENPTENFGRMVGRPPEEALFYWTGGPVEVAPRTWFQSFFSGVTAFETDDGLVLVDTGTAAMASGLAASVRSKTDAPVHTAIYTHGHVDHAFGVDNFLAEGQAPPRVIGHRAMPARFARYTRTSQHNQAINARQFGGTVEMGIPVDWGVSARPPDTLYEDRLTIEVGGVTFELHHSRGETDDHTWVYCPERGVLCPGDLIIWGVPNAGNPQKAQRYPWDWAAGLREMAAYEPRSLCPGHGGPVVDDAPLVRRILLETADFLDDLVDQTIAVLEDGSPPHVDVVRRVVPRENDSPWLTPVYDEAEFIVRNVIRYFGGWWTGRPSELKPAPRSDVAAEVARLAGGAEALAARARELAESGDLRLASHVADWALEADPESETVQETVSDVHEQRAESETSLMAVNLFRSAASYARSGRPYS